MVTAAVDVAALLDEGRFSTYQTLLIFGTALTIVLDGVDNQLLANAIPSMMAEWRLPRAAFATRIRGWPVRHDDRVPVSINRAAPHSKNTEASAHCSRRQSGNKEPRLRS